jgi:N-acetylated-alpha-linked acidic dipeptidase
VTEVTNLTDDMRESTESSNALIADGIYKLADDPRETWSAPKLQAPVPYLNFAPIQNSLKKLDASARAYDAGFSRAITAGRVPSASMSLDEILFRTERAMTRNEGLPRRSWFRHHVYAPGYYTGYGVKTLPGIREAIEQRDWNEATKQIEITASVLDKVSAEIDRATKALQ